MLFPGLKRDRTRRKSMFWNFEGLSSLTTTTSQLLVIRMTPKEARNQSAYNSRDNSGKRQSRPHISTPDPDLARQRYSRRTELSKLNRRSSALVVLPMSSCSLFGASNSEHPSCRGWVYISAGAVWTMGMGSLYPSTYWYVKVSAVPLLLMAVVWSPLRLCLRMRR